MGKMHVQTRQINREAGKLMRARKRVGVLCARGWSTVYRLRAGHKIRAVEAVTQLRLKLARLRAVRTAGLAEFGGFKRTRTFYRGPEEMVRGRPGPVVRRRA